MKKNNNTLGKIAIMTAAVGLGTYVYKKLMDKNSKKDENLNNRVVEIEDLEDLSCDGTKTNEPETNSCCGCSSEEANSSFEIKLDNLNNEESNSEEKNKEDNPIG
ncbi:hypothetical protein [Clostridium lundense]|uniref:hypothetical protein n=1 Tax=Clostridium lundense TaxID=319475 RepID=UPI000480FCBE|nr:hypothetical protein [Clostridium lundense]